MYFVNSFHKRCIFIKHIHLLHFFKKNIYVKADVQEEPQSQMIASANKPWQTVVKLQPKKSKVASSLFPTKVIRMPDRIHQTQQQDNELNAKKKKKKKKKKNEKKKKTTKKNKKTKKNNKTKQKKPKNKNNNKKKKKKKKKKKTEKKPHS